MSTGGPSLEAFIERLMELRLADLHVSLPARVLKYDAQKQMADVQPCIKRKYSDGKLVDLPVITNVPVFHFRSGTAHIHIPIKTDDYVQLVFSERSLDRWAKDGGNVDPGDPRKHHLSDAIAYPGGYPFSDAFEVNNDTAIEIHNGSTEVRVAADGAVSIKTDSILLGDHSLTKSAAVAEAVESRLSALESGLNSLVSTYNGHTHPYVDTPIGPSVTSPSTSPGSFSPDTSTVASSVVKVKE